MKFMIVAVEGAVISEKEAGRRRRSCGGQLRRWRRRRRAPGSLHMKVKKNGLMEKVFSVFPV